jgi:lipid II:glycine glycyltransferase (peptidoglycan interpeptide bridge formation enzyme)
MLLTEDGQVVGAAQVLIRPLPGGMRGLAWVNRGPLLFEEPGEASERFIAALSALGAHYVERRRMYLRVAPGVAEDSPTARHLPSGKYSFTATAGWSSSRLDLTPPLDELRRNLRQKWRNCLNKAERLGVEARVSTERRDLDIFTAAYAEHLTRHGLHKSLTPKLLTEYSALLDADRSPLVMTVERNGAPVAWALVPRYGTTGEYIAGITLEAGRAVNAGQVLLWTAVVHLKRSGMTTLDLGGMDAADRDSGPSRFKAGLSGAPYRLVPEIEAHTGGWRPAAIRRLIEVAR